MNAPAALRVCGQTIRKGKAMQKINYTRTEYVIDGRTLETMTQVELLEVIKDLTLQIDNIRAERNAIERVMNKFLAKDHPEQLEALLIRNNEVDRRY